MDGEPTPSLADRARARLAQSLSKKRRIRHVQQLQWTDCGAACLAMVLDYHGKSVPLADIRQRLGVSRDGVNARQILDAATGYGLRGRGLQLEPDDLVELAPGTILHWEFNHFIVFEKVSTAGVSVVDPGAGRRNIPHERFAQAFTGVAIELAPSDGFETGGETVAPGRKRPSPLRRYLGMILSERKVLTKVIGTSAILRLAALAVPLFVGLVVDHVVPRGDLGLLSIATIGFVLLALFEFLTQMVREHLMLELRAALDSKLTLGFLEHMAALPYQFFQERPTGDLMMRVSSNATVREILTSNTLSALLDGALVLLYVVFVMVLSPLIGAVVLLIAALQVSLYLASRRKTRELMADDLEAQAKSQSYLVQLLGGIETLKSSGAEAQAVSRWSNLFVDELNVAMRRGRLTALVDSARSALERIAPLVILFVGANLVVAQHLSLGTMLALNTLAAGIFLPLSTLVSSALKLQLLSSYLERIDDVVDTPREQAQPGEPAHQLGGEITLRDVSFRYGPHMKDAVSDVSLDIAPGSLVAIVGPSGCGKSTLARLIGGLFEPSAGRVYFDGRDAARVDRTSLRRQLGVVQQDPYLFGASIRENIALTMPEAELHRIAWAARVACVHEDIVGMPMGYETPLPDGGGGLSGGQRQRLAIARAVLRTPAVMILDEATSALDTHTENLLTDNLAQLRCTRVVIAHRLSTVANADVIVVMDRGRVVEIGGHRDLVARRGLYSRLVAAQDLEPERQLRGGAA